MNDPFYGNETGPIVYKTFEDLAGRCPPRSYPDMPVADSLRVNTHLPLAQRNTLQVQFRVPPAGRASPLLLFAYHSGAPNLCSPRNKDCRPLRFPLSPRCAPEAAVTAGREESRHRSDVAGRRFHRTDVQGRWENTTHSACEGGTQVVLQRLADVLAQLLVIAQFRRILC